MDLMQSLIASKLLGGGGGSEPILKTKSIYENGSYAASADNADGYSSVTVDVQPHLNTRTIKNNGEFIGAVDGLDGYDKVIIDVNNGSPNYESLNVTQNGTYVPSSSTVITFGLADGIPELEETSVPAGGLVTRKDKLTVKCVNNTTNENVTASIQTALIVNKAEPQSLVNKTLILCEDADHFVYITKADYYLYVIQKGYTFNGQSFELQNNDSAYNMVTVNVPTGPDIDYLYDWDFTESLTDKVEGQTAVLSGATRDSEGLHFTSASHYCVLFSNYLNMLGKTLEIDILSMSLTEGKYVVTHDNVSGAGVSSYSPLIYQSYNGTLNWLAHGYSNTGPSNKFSNPYNTNLGAGAFNNKTVKIVYLTDGTLLYIDDEFVGRQSECNLTKNSLRYMRLGGSNNSYYNMTITGCRIYNNILTEKTITQNGTYYAPDDNVEGYLKVNVNLPDGTNTAY